jgi:hypothetical protein
MDIRRPLAVFARVVEVKHRGDRIDAESVDMEFLEPVQGVRNEEVADFVAAEIEDVRAPVAVLTAPRVGVLVEGLAVEPGECERILGEVAGNPVHDHADAGLMQTIDQVSQVIRGAEAAGGGEVPRHLVAPRAAEGMLREREELDVREALSRHVLDQLVGAVAV